MSDRVLVGHDIDCEAADVTQYLAAHGYDARAAYDGRSLIELAKSWKPHAAVVELGLPGRSAFDVARALRSHFRKEIRLVAFTVPSRPHLLREAIYADYDHTVVNLTDPGEILLALGPPGPDLLRRAQGVTFVRARAMIELGNRHLRDHPRIVGPFERRRSVVLMRHAIDWVRYYLDGGPLEAEQRARVEAELVTLTELADALEERESGVL